MNEKLAYQWETGSSSAAILHACMRSKTFFFVFSSISKIGLLQLSPK